MLEEQLLQSDIVEIVDAASSLPISSVIPSASRHCRRSPASAAAHGRPDLAHSDYQRSDFAHRAARTCAPQTNTTAFAVCCILVDASSIDVISS